MTYHLDAFDIYIGDLGAVLQSVVLQSFCWGVQVIMSERSNEFTI